MRIAPLVVVVALIATVDAQQSPGLRQVAIIPLPNVSGRIDHLGFDEPRQHLFVAALGHNTVEVVDTSSNRHLRSLPQFHEPQGIAVVAELNAVAIANGGTGTLQLIDALSLQTRWTINVGDDADNVRYDATAKRLYVAAVGGLYAVDPSSGKALGRIAINGHPESFQLESGGSRVFANLPGMLSSQIVAGDRQTMTASPPWTSEGCGGNYPMALDESASRLFIGCRRPSKLGMLDNRSGTYVTSIDTVGDTDDLFFDATRQRVYVIGGEGFVDVVTRRGDHLERSGRIATRAGARTGLWVPALNRLYVAVPARGGQSAEIRVLTAE